ncbi:MAG TPA: TRC40/GET3/ArsA family transport-energizing ATPase [Thermoplasmata archaeon]|nr:TRC40/GET3/ArsA family transport-energizing ATPase [Thermoplasmata archaeon]
MRVVLYTGKGGVGKTSVAAATALGAAARGHETLVISTDSAHSLGDALGMSLGSRPTPVVEHLHALEVDVLTEVAQNWSEVHGYLLALLAHQGVQEITAQEVVILPGMELITALLRLGGIEQEGRFDTVILDTAPTADTLRLLSFPTAVEWYFQRIFPFQRQLTRVVRSTVGRAMKTPLPSDRFFASLASLHERFQRVRALLTDSRRTTVRLVVNPERMVIAETQRAHTYLALFGLTVELLVVNRILPVAATADYFAATRAEQEQNLLTLTERFGELPQLPVPRYPTEVIGLEPLRRLGQDLFGRHDPVRLWPTRPPMRFREVAGHPLLELSLPHTEGSQVDLAQRGDTLFVTVGAYRRSIVLPYAYARRRVERAYVEEGKFLIRFGAAKEGENAAA